MFADAMKPRLKPYGSISKIARHTEDVFPPVCPPILSNSGLFMAFIAFVLESGRSALKRVCVVG